MNRLNANRRILRLLGAYVNKNPTQRFGQVLVNLNILEEGTNMFFVESDDTLKSLEAALEHYGS